MARPEASCEALSHRPSQPATTAARITLAAALRIQALPASWHRIPDRIIVSRIVSRAGCPAIRPSWLVCIEIPLEIMRQPFEKTKLGGPGGAISPGAGDFCNPVSMQKRLDGQLQTQFKAGDTFDGK